MKKISLCLAVIICLFFFNACKEKEEVTPTPNTPPVVVQPDIKITATSPSEVLIGTEVKISGENFLADANATKVYIDSLLCTIKEVKDTYIITTIPDVKTVKPNIHIQSGKKSFTAKNLFTINGPIILDFSPRQGTNLTEITVKGKNFTNSSNLLLSVLRENSEPTFGPIEIITKSDTLIKFRHNYTKTSDTKIYFQIKNDLFTVKTSEPFFVQKQFKLPKTEASPMGRVSSNFYYSSSNSFSANNMTIGGKKMVETYSWVGTEYFTQTYVVPELKPGKYKISMVDNNGIPAVAVDGIDSVTIVDAEFSFSPVSISKSSTLTLSLPYGLPICNGSYPQFECFNNKPKITFQELIGGTSYSMSITDVEADSNLNLKIPIPADQPSGQYKITVTSPEGIYEFKPKSGINTLTIN